MDSDIEETEVEKEVEKETRKVVKTDKEKGEGRRRLNGRQKVGESSSESENDLQTEERRAYGINKKVQMFGPRSIGRGSGGGSGENTNVPIKILFKDAIMQMVRYFDSQFFPFLLWNSLPILAKHFCI